MRFLIIIITLAFSLYSDVGFDLDSGKTFVYSRNYIYNTNTGEHIDFYDTINLVLNKPIKLTSQTWYGDKGWMSYGCGGECYIELKEPGSSGNIFINPIKNKDYIKRIDNTLTLQKEFEGTYLFTLGDTRRAYCRIKCKSVDDTSYVPYLGIFDNNSGSLTPEKLDTISLKINEKKSFCYRRTTTKKLDTIMWDPIGSTVDIQWKVVFNNKNIDCSLYKESYLHLDGFKEPGEGYIQARYFDELTKAILIVDGPVYAINQKRINISKQSNQNEMFDIFGRKMKDAHKCKGIFITKHSTLVKLK